MHELKTGDKFNHCSTICPLEDGVVVAWYAGPKECHEKQSVHLIFIKNGYLSPIYKVGNSTGNPVLIKNDDNIQLMWSKFEKHDVKSIVEKWRYCSLWTGNVVLSTNKTPIVKPCARITAQDEHLLGRCLPIKFNDKLLLPLYNEVEANCVLYDINSHSIISRYSTNTIQPTLWEYNGKLWSMGRNFRTERTNIILYQSDDGKTWSEGLMTALPNNNSSLHVGKWGSDQMILWNDTIDHRRYNMTLAILVQYNHIINIRNPVIVGAYGAYPSMCEDTQNRLHMTFTTSKGYIRHYAWTKEQFGIVSRGRNIVG